MKPLIRFPLGCGSIIIIPLVAFIIYGAISYFNSDNWTARSPHRICKQVGFNLPSYSIREKSDNMDRSSSSWSWYYWSIKTKKRLSEKNLQQLEQLVKNDPNWNGCREDRFIYKNYKDFWEPGYNMDVDNFESPKTFIEIDATGNCTIRYEFYDSWF